VPTLVDRGPEADVRAVLDDPGSRRGRMLPDQTFAAVIDNYNVEGVESLRFDGLETLGVQRVGIKPSSVSCIPTEVER
jgi:hypothetical protein